MELPNQYVMSHFQNNLKKSHGNNIKDIKQWHKSKHIPIVILIQSVSQQTKGSEYTQHSPCRENSGFSDKPSHRLGDWWEDTELEVEGTGDGPVGPLGSCESWEGTGLALGSELLQGETVVPGTSPAAA